MYLCCEQPIQERIREEIGLVILIQSINLKFPVVLIVAAHAKCLADMIEELRVGPGSLVGGISPAFRPFGQGACDVS